MRTFNYILLLLICLKSAISSGQPDLKQPGEWNVISSSVQFKIKNAGFTVDGSFSGLAAKISFDGSKNTGNSIEASVESKSIKTGIGTRDGHLKKEDYFHAEKYPKIILAATLFDKEKNGTFTGHFKLTLKGKSKEILIPFTFIEKDGKAILKSTFTINRLDFGVGGSSMLLSDNAVITIEVTAIKK